MKKTLVMTLVLALILSVASFVSAATVSTPATAEEGSTVTVTVDLGEGNAVRGGVVRLSYDANVLKLNGRPAELDGIETRDLGKDTPGKEGVYFTGDKDTKIQTLTFTFTVVGEVNDKTTVAVSGQDFFVGEELTDVEVTFPAAKELTVVAKADENQGTTQDPADENKEDNKGDNQGTPAPEENKNTDTPKKYPQTGLNVGYIAGAVVLAVVAGYVVSKRA